MREFDLSDFKEETDEQTTETPDDEFEPVVIEAERLDPEGALHDATFTELAADEIKRQFARRDAHIKIFTSQFKIVGKLLVPAEGAMTRLTDTLNIPEKVFLPITEAEVTSLTTGKAIQTNTFVAVNKNDVRIIIPIVEPAKPKGKIDFTGDSFREEDMEPK